MPCFYSLCMCRKLTSTTMVGMRLRRSYTPPAANAAEVDLGREETDDFAARVPVDKLVFVVHGIGQVTRALVHRAPLVSRLTAHDIHSASCKEAPEQIAPVPGGPSLYLGCSIMCQLGKG